MAKKQTQTKRSSKKVDRNRPFCQAYSLSGVRRKNKLRKIVRHMKKQPNDAQAKAAHKRIDKDIMWGN